MEKLVEQLKVAKEKIRKVNIFSITTLVVVALGAAFMIYGLVVRRGNQVADALFAVGLGLVAGGVAINTTVLIVYRHEFDEYYHVKREIRHAKHKGK